MKLRNGAHIDGVIDINPDATLAIAQHNASTPFLSLPLEVKNMIYNYAFGGNLIHIVNIATFPYRGLGNFTNTICRAEISEVEAQKNFDDESENDWNAPGNEGRHQRCYCPSSATSRDGEKQRPEILNLGALRACRQMYNEAHYIPYSANTFACADPSSLQSFILSLSVGGHKNNLAVRSLFLDMVSTTLPEDENACWRKALSTCVSKCKNVKNVNISLEMQCWYWMHGARSPAEFEAKGPNWQTTFISDIFVLKKLPLKSATFVMNDANMNKGVSLITCVINLLGELTRWTLEEKREWARYVRELILR